mgnify:FL=1
MKSAGYTTGIFGKWGLGNPGSVSIPNKMGFDEFYGYNCQRSRIPSIRIIYGIMRRRFFFLKTRTMLARHIHKI